MALCKTAVTPLLMHWSYCSLALIHWYGTVDLICCLQAGLHCHSISNTMYIFVLTNIFYIITCTFHCMQQSIYLVIRIQFTVWYKFSHFNASMAPVNLLNPVRWDCIIYIQYFRFFFFRFWAFLMKLPSYMTWQWVNNGLAPSGNKPLPNSCLTKFHCQEPMSWWCFRELFCSVMIMACHLTGTKPQLGQLVTYDQSDVLNLLV